MTTKIFRIVPMDYSGNACGNAVFTEREAVAAAAIFDGDDVSFSEVEFEQCEVLFVKVPSYTYKNEGTNR
tara:strand:+ start:256 stop:465 length:210 start_codon:yes stop_codon:yes gene_type:complete